MKICHSHSFTMSASAVRARTRSQTHQQHQQLSLEPQPKSKLLQKKAVKRVAAAQTPSTGSKVGKLQQPVTDIDRTPSKSKITAAGPRNKQATAVIPSNQQAAPSYRNNDPDLLRFAASPLVKVKTFKLKGICDRVCLFDGKIYCPLLHENCIDVHSLEGELLDSVRLPGDVYEPRSLHPLPPQHLLLATRSGLYLLNNRGQVQQKIHKEACHDVYCNNQKIVTIGSFCVTEPGGTDSKGDNQKDKEVESHDLRVLDSSPPYTERVSLLDQPGVAVTMLCHGDLINIGEWHMSQVVTYKPQLEFLHSYSCQDLEFPCVCCSDGSGNILVTSPERLLLLTPDGGWQQIHEAGSEKDVAYSDAFAVGDKLYLNDRRNEQISVYKVM